MLREDYAFLWFLNKVQTFVVVTFILTVENNGD